eukprot:jgi/Astpho2/7050/Aster-01895
MLSREAQSSRRSPPRPKRIRKVASEGLQCTAPYAESQIVQGRIHFSKLHLYSALTCMLEAAAAHEAFSKPRCKRPPGRLH